MSGSERIVRIVWAEETVKIEVAASRTESFMVGDGNGGWLQVTCSWLERGGETQL